MAINWRALRDDNDTPFLALDIIMMLLITGNLLWLLLDAILLNTGIGVLLSRHYPEIIQHYKTVWHENLLVADSIFTLVLIAELLLRWGVAIYQKTYHRWFFYPFVRWYDVLGCIPLPPFRALRLLRLISIGYRLHKKGILDLSQYPLFSAANRYYNILVEELSDRIVLNVLDGVQQEVVKGGYINRGLADEVLRPHRDRIVPWVVNLMAETSAKTHLHHRAQLHGYLRDTVKKSIATNPDFQKIRKRLLFAGPVIEDELQRMVSGLLVQITEELLTDLSQPHNETLIKVATDVFDSLTEPRHGDEDDLTLQHILIDALNLIKERVKVQQWKMEDNNSPTQM